METSNNTIVAYYQALSTYKLQKYLQINCVCTTCYLNTYLVFIPSILLWEY